jgi:hypothetical protein
MVLDDWERLLPRDPDVAAVRAAARPALALVADAAEAGRLRFAAGGRALLHPHCHEKAVFGSGDSERALGALPDLDLTILDTGCCGMSGVFGYQAEHYELSVAIAERALLPAIRSAGGGGAERAPRHAGAGAFGPPPPPAEPSTRSSSSPAGSSRRRPGAAGVSWQPGERPQGRDRKRECGARLRNAARVAPRRRGAGAPRVQDLPSP